MILSINRKRRENLQSNQIVMLRGDRNYTVFYLSNGKKIMNPYTLKIYDKQLESEGFLRVHRGCLVNTLFLSAYDEEGKSILLKNGLKAQVSRRKTGALKEFLRKNSEFVEFVTTQI